MDNFILNKEFFHGIFLYYFHMKLSSFSIYCELVKVDGNSVGKNKRIKEVNESCRISKGKIIDSKRKTVSFNFVHDFSFGSL